MINSVEESIRAFLLTFVDFLYAVLFGVILQQTFEDVVLNDTLVLREKLVRITLVIGVFYFLVGDWIQGRLLTIRNPYEGYRRFFVEISIAFAGFGAAITSLHADIRFVAYVVGVLFLGSYWAYITLKEYPQSEDARELFVIQIVQLFTAAIGGVSSFLWYRYVGELISWGGLAMLYTIGWLYDFSYRLLAPLHIGLVGGPSVPFISRERMRRIRTFFEIPE